MEIKEKILDIEDVKKSKLPLLQLFIRKTAVMTSVSEHLVELIIKDQWNNANKQTKEGSVISEIDFPNIGVFYISKKKSERRIDTLIKASDTLLDRINNIESSEKEKIEAEVQIVRNTRTIENINNKNKMQYAGKH